MPNANTRAKENHRPSESSLQFPLESVCAGISPWFFRPVSGFRNPLGACYSEARKLLATCRTHFQSLKSTPCLTELAPFFILRCTKTEFGGLTRKWTRVFRLNIRPPSLKLPLKSMVARRRVSGRQQSRATIRTIGTPLRPRLTRFPDGEAALCQRRAPGDSSRDSTCG